MKMFSDMVCYQEEVRDPTRVAEVLSRVITQAWRGCAPAQINIPRDYWTQVVDIELPQVIDLESPAGGAKAIAQAAGSCRTVISTCVLWLPAQRCIPGFASNGSWPIGLQRIQGCYGVDCQG